ncbi:MAG: NAD(+)/NADH kinase [Desulfobacteraceae bacterium]|nr:MAG: NAD(+)/NADH kinase [Desulfobacteraceae bacterium]
MGSVTVGIIYKNRHLPAGQEAKRLEEWLTSRGIDVFSEEMKPGDSDIRGDQTPSSIPTTADWMVVLGGDGTLLGAARMVGKYGVPILGVNLGGLGFLTMVPLESMYKSVERMLSGDLVVEKRVMLEASVIRKEKEARKFHVLNDLVINKMTLARIIDLSVTIDGEVLTTFRGDGLIIATPTGSTAYNLAAGGPILYPTMAAFIVTPICPFTLSNRPILIPDTAKIIVEMGKESEEKVILTCDGQIGFDLCYGDKVVIYKSDIKISLLRPPNYSYFNILRTKLMWGGATFNANT